MPCLVLDFHAAYRCRHSGACCTSGWPIPLEAPLVLELRRAMASGALTLAASEAGLAVEPLETPAGLPPEIGGLTRSDRSGACAFYQRGSGLCAIHGQLGPDTLPTACAHFPRVCLIDEDATYVTLSHYCPTAADLLFDPPADDEGPASEPGGGGRCAAGRLSGAVTTAPGLLTGIEAEGLDARGQLPPLLRPGMLANRAAYRRWERFVVAELATGVGTVEASLARAARVSDRVCEWSPGDGGSLEQHIEGCIEGSLSPHEAGLASTSLGPEERGSARGTRASMSGSALDTSNLYDHVRTSCPPRLAPPAAAPDLEQSLVRFVDPEWEAWSPVVGRYLAAKVFGSWLAYQGRGVRTVLAGALAALAVLRVEAALQCAAKGRCLDAPLLKEAIRQADLLLLHLASREILAKKLDHLSIR